MKKNLNIDLNCDSPHVTTITIIEENDGQDKTRSRQTEIDEVSSKHSRFDDILCWIVTIFIYKENNRKWRFGRNVITFK